MVPDGRTGNRWQGNALITVVFRESGFEAVAWARRNQRNWNCLRRVVERRSESPLTAYVASLTRLREAFARHHRVGVAWVLDAEALPEFLLNEGCRNSGGNREKADWLGRATFLNQAVGIGPTDWICQLGRDLPDSELPARVYWGTGLVEHRLRAMDFLADESVAFLAPIEGRLLFFAHTGSGPLLRISRPSSEISPEEWLHQSLLIRSHRSSNPLRKLYIPQSGKVLDFPHQPMAAEFPIIRLDSHQWPCRLLSGDPEGTGLHHILVTGAVHESPAEVTIPYLQWRRTTRVWERRALVATSLLLAGWCLAFLSACRSGVDRGLTYQEVERELGVLVAERREREQSLERHGEGAYQTLLPLRLVGKVSKTLPQGVAIQRIQMEKAGDSFHLQLEGDSMELATSDNFEKWLQSLQAGVPECTVRNLQLHPRKKGIHFVMEGAAQ